MTPTGWADRLLDRSVLLGYTRIGPALRRRWWPPDPAPGALTGRSVAVTGANSGLGKAAAVGAARLGAEVWLLCRDEGRGHRARREVLDEVPGAAVYVLGCDVSDLAGLPGVAARLREGAPRLHALVHNAGVLPPERTESPQGHELTLATHVLGPHLLTALLRDALTADGDGRVLFVTSGGMYTTGLRIDDPEYTRGAYTGARAYARTKRMQVHLAEAWAQELAGEPVAAHSVHPGWAATPGLGESLPGFSRLLRPLLRSADSGADTVVWLLVAAQARGSTGLLWHDRAPRPTSYLSRTRPGHDDVLALWDLCVRTTGLPAVSRDQPGGDSLSG